MKLLNWSACSAATFFYVIWRTVVNALGSALAGLVVALVYNAVASMMGGIKLNIQQEMRIGWMNTACLQPFDPNSLPQMQP